MYIAPALYAFFATTYVASAAADPFVYNTATINYGLGFNTTTMTQFTPPRTGLYWFFATVAWFGTTPQEMNLKNTDASAPAAKIIRRHTQYSSFDTISRDFIRQSTTSQVLTSSTSFRTVADTAGYGSSWGGFFLDNIMSPLVS